MTEASPTPREAWSPRVSLRAACARQGEGWVVERCVRLLEGDALDLEIGEILAGPAARQVLSGAWGGDTSYWPRVWALRGLLYAWSQDAAASVVARLNDDSWRAREMALKVIARHRIDAALEGAAARQDDPVARVRRAAERALVALATAEPATRAGAPAWPGRPRAGGAKGARLTP